MLYNPVVDCYSKYGNTPSVCGCLNKCEFQINKVNTTFKQIWRRHEDVIYQAGNNFSESGSCYNVNPKVDQVSLGTKSLEFGFKRAIEIWGIN